MIGKMLFRLTSLLAVLSFTGCGAPLTSETSRTDPSAQRQMVFERARRQQSGKTPSWVQAIPDRLGDILVEKHLYRDGEVWGLARRFPEQQLAYDEVGSAEFLMLVRRYNLFDKVVHCHLLKLG